MFANFWQILTRQKKSSPSTGSGCLKCGNCCKAFGGHLQASAADLRRWRELEREDILAHVGSNGYLWIDPASRHITSDCPFLEPLAEERFGCSIHAIKPDICRAYPTLAHARRCLRGAFIKGGAFCCAWWEWGLGEVFCLH